MSEQKYTETRQAGRIVRSFFSYDPLRSQHPIDLLTAIGVSYIALPNLAFLFGWLDLPIAIILSTASFIALTQLFSGMDRRWRPEKITLVLFVVAALWCVFGGAGHFTFANLDWHVRDAVYGDLIHSEWPPAYSVSKDSALVLRSAFAYFLIPALITTYLGIGVADIALYSWTVLGVTIFLNLLPLDAGRIGKSLFLVTVVILFSGMDIVGIFITTGYWPIFPLRMEWWTSFSYTSISGQLFWAPNHNLPMWIGTALFFRHWAHPSFLRLAMVFAPLTLIWTPFALIALAPFFVFYLASRFAHGKPEWPTSAQIVSGLALGLIVARFLTLDIGGVQSKTGIEHAGGEENFWYAYLVFTLTEFGALALLLGSRLRHSQGIFLVAVAVLLALPFVFFGPSNDLLLRVSSPALVLLAILTVTVFDDAVASNSWRAFPWAILGILVIGACTPFNEFWRAATWRHWQADYRKTLLDTQNGGMPAHYIGRLDTTRFTWFIKAPKTIPPGDKR